MENSTIEKKKFDLVDVFMNLTLLDKLSLIGALLVIVACFLPFVKVSFMGFNQSVTLLEGDAFIYIPLALVIAATVYFKKRLASVIFGVVNVVFVLISISGMKGQMSYDGMDMSGFIKNGLGFYLLIIGTGLIIFSVVKTYLDERQLQEKVITEI